LAEYKGRVIIYIDESGCDERIHYEYVWSREGERVEDLKQGSRGKRTSILAGYEKGELIAPLTFEGSCNRSVIEKWLEEQLLPRCREGTVLVMDNASFHKGGKIKELIEGAKCELLYLAPYSPDMNPIEKCWGWLKRIIRRERKNHENIRETVDYVIANLS
jgi:transposase